MATERLFGERHLPEGMRIATNGGKTLDDFSSAIRAVLRDSALASEGLASKIMSSSFVDDSDTPSIKTHTQKMNDITREELNAKLETIEVKMDARVESVSAKIDGFLSAQAERDKAQLERDKRYELLADRVTKAAEGAEEAAKQAATVKSNYWAAVIVQLLAVVAILVGAYYANQANVLGAMQTTMSAFQAGKGEAPIAPPANPHQTQAP